MIVATSCGGGGGNDVVAPSKCLQFAAAEAPGAGTVAARKATGSTCDIGVVECVVTDQTDVFSAGFAVTYPSAVVDYLGYSVEGSVLRSDGAVLKVLEQKEAGRVTIGIARTDVTTGINVTGSAVLISLRFGKRSTVTASGALAFENGRLLGSETPPQEKPGIRWTGGTLAVN